VIADCNIVLEISSRPLTDGFTKNSRATNPAVRSLGCKRLCPPVKWRSNLDPVGLSCVAVDMGRPIAIRCTHGIPMADFPNLAAPTAGKLLAMV
jgi:hypothetical protein